MKDFLEVEFRKKSFAEIDFHEIMNLFLKSEYEGNTDNLKYRDKTRLPFFCNQLIKKLKDCVKKIEGLKVEELYDLNTVDSLLIKNSMDEVFYISNGINDEISIICHDSGNNNLRFQIILAIAKQDEESQVRSKVISKYSLNTPDQRTKLLISCTTNFEKEIINQERSIYLEDYSKNNIYAKEKLILNDLNDNITLPNQSLNEDFVDLLNIKYDIENLMSRSLFSFLMNESLESKDSMFIKKMISSNQNKDKSVKICYNK